METKKHHVVSKSTSKRRTLSYMAQKGESRVHVDKSNLALWGDNIIELSESFSNSVESISSTLLPIRSKKKVDSRLKLLVEFLSKSSNPRLQRLATDLNS